MVSVVKCVLTVTLLQNEVPITCVLEITLLCLVRVERSTDQVIKPVNVEALSKWVGKIPADVVRDMAVIAPMLSRLGYDPHANPPNYGQPDPKVLDNTRRVSTKQTCS